MEERTRQHDTRNPDPREPWEIEKLAAVEKSKDAMQRWDFVKEIHREHARTRKEMRESLDRVFGQLRDMSDDHRYESKDVSGLLQQTRNLAEITRGVYELTLDTMEKTATDGAVLYKSLVQQIRMNHRLARLLAETHGLDFVEKYANTEDEDEAEKLLNEHAGRRSDDQETPMSSAGDHGEQELGGNPK